MPQTIWTLREFEHESSLGIFHRRSNPYLKTIDSLLSHYHLQNKQSPSLEVNLLLSLCDACQEYCDNKITSHRATAVIALFGQIKKRVSTLIAQKITGQHLGHGHKGWAKVQAAVNPLVQGVSGPAGQTRRLLHNDYWHEVIIQDHFLLSRVTPDARDPMAEWKASSSPLNFIDWVREMYIPDLIEKRKGRDILWQLRSGVEYLDEAKRQEHRIIIRDGVIYNSRNEKFHTGMMQTHVSGKGWAIFIMAPDNSIYSHSHKVGAFHHSSFLSGGAIQAAGEIAVDNGRIVAINNKSGHYRPDSASMVRILFWLRHHGVDLHHVAACPKITAGVREFYSAEEVLLNNGGPGLTMVIPERVSKGTV